jgi:hypothetical protein
LNALLPAIVSIFLPLLSKAISKPFINFSNSFKPFSKVSTNCFSSLSISSKIVFSCSFTFG